MEGSSIGSYLIDPELIAASDEYAFDINFWDRLAMVAEFEEYALIGAEAMYLFDSFCEYCFTHAEVFSTISPEYGQFDITNVLSSLSFVSSIDRQEVSSSADALYDIPEGQYKPVFGREGCADALSFDLAEMSDPRIIVDRNSWPSLVGELGRPLDNLFAVDINYGPKGCVRTWLNENMSYDNIKMAAPVAFPNLRFCDESWRQIDVLRQREHELSKVLFDYLSLLNDHALEIWKTTPLKEKRERLMNALGVNCGPENPRDTRGRYGEMRTFHYHGQALAMNWHAKLTNTFGRVYFDVDTTNDTTTIGLITSHLAVSNGNLRR